MIAAAPITPYFLPSISCAAKPKGANGWKCVASKCGRVSATKPARATSFTQTRTKLTVALSRVPTSSTPVTTSAMNTAGRFTRPPASGPASRLSGIGMCAPWMRPAA